MSTLSYTLFDQLLRLPGSWNAAQLRNLMSLLREIITGLTPTHTSYESTVHEAFPNSKLRPLAHKLERIAAVRRALVRVNKIHNSIKSQQTSKITMPSTSEQNDVTLALGKIEQAEHLEEMEPAIALMKDRPLFVKAYSMDDPSAPSVEELNVKCVHFVRHGQGFHNLMADLAKEQGKTWKNVSDMANRA
jgi:hypothetical protein